MFCSVFVWIKRKDEPAGVEHPQSIEVEPTDESFVYWEIGSSEFRPHQISGLSGSANATLPSDLERDAEVLEFWELLQIDDSYL